MSARLVKITVPVIINGSAICAENSLPEDEPKWRVEVDSHSTTFDHNSSVWQITHFVAVAALVVATLA